MNEPPLTDAESPAGTLRIEYQILALFPMDDRGTGHIADCGYDANDERCDCSTLPARIAARVAEAVDRERAAWVAKIEAAIERAVTLSHGWAGFRSEFVAADVLRALLPTDDTTTDQD